MTRRALLLAIVVLAAACSGGDDADDAAPARARIPDVEGVVSAVDAEQIVIDGERYVLAEDAASVSTYTLEVVPVRVDSFVHAGLDDDTGQVQWVATIGLVSDTDPPRVRYTGRVRERTDERVVFDDGTALRVSPDLRVPESFLAVELDPTTDEIVAVQTP